MSALGQKRTLVSYSAMSAFDPKRTSVAPHKRRLGSRSHHYRRPAIRNASVYRFWGASRGAGATGATGYQVVQVVEPTAVPNIPVTTFAIAPTASRYSAQLV